MISSESLKGKVRNIAKEKNLSSQEILQMFFFERFLERLSNSRYRYNFVIKGGLLISSMIGIDNRTTMDMDATVKGIPLQEDRIKEIIASIISIDIDDGIIFEITDINHIREEDEYENFRIHLTANFGKMKNAMKLDITTGDEIIPREIEYFYPCMFEKTSIKILAYPLETILAEKYETIIKRNIATTRMRDYYDLYSLYHLRKDGIDFEVLKQAILATAAKRESLTFIKDAREIIEDIRIDSYLNDLWQVYLTDSPYAEQLNFLDTVEVVAIIADKIRD